MLNSISIKMSLQGSVLTVHSPVPVGMPDAGQSEVFGLPVGWNQGDLTVAAILPSFDPNQPWNVIITFLSSDDQAMSTVMVSRQKKEFAGGIIRSVAKMLVAIVYETPSGNASYRLAVRPYANIPVEATSQLSTPDPNASVELSVADAVDSGNPVPAVGRPVKRGARKGTPTNTRKGKKRH